METFRNRATTYTAPIKNIEANDIVDILNTLKIMFNFLTENVTKEGQTGGFYSWFRVRYCISLLLYHLCEYMISTLADSYLKLKEYYNPLKILFWTNHWRLKERE